jgi:hypothetical protein
MPPRLRFSTSHETSTSIVNRPVAPARLTFQENDKDEEICQALRHFLPELTAPDLESLLSKLADYRIVHRICDLQKGRYHRWINLSGRRRLESGGKALSVTFTDNGAAVLCRLGGMRVRFANFHFDKCLTFERLSDNEVVMLAALSEL